MTTHSHQSRFIRLIDYMYANVEGDLDVNTLADVACMSPYHFHRTYRTYVGETVYATVKRMRLLRAAVALVRSTTPISQIATSACYTSVEAFTRAFRQHYNETPAAFRQRSVDVADKVTGFYPQTRAKDLTMFDIEMQHLTSIPVIGIHHQGDYTLVGQAFDKLTLMAEQLGLIDNNSRFFGVYYDDPQSVGSEQLRAFACVSVEGKDLPVLPAELEASQLPTGQAATLLFKGDYSELEQAYNWMFGEWLPQSGEVMANFPPFEEYLNDNRTTPPHELLTRIHCMLDQ